MLSYRHGFHAGNFADVLKHSLITLTINALKQKEKPFVYIDTHAGAGKYSLKSGFAQKTGEYQQGIGRLWEKPEYPPELQDYFSAVRAENIGHSLERYPGSPQLVRRLIRSKDRMLLSELHGTDYEALKQLFAQDRQVSVVKEDGLKTLEKKLPPIQKRGFILIDPSYEIKTDFSNVVKTLVIAYKHFATGVYALWYPVIDRGVTEKMLLKLKETGIPKQLRIEHCIAADGSSHGMTGSGMLFINPPWQLAAQAETILYWLNKMLTDDLGHWQVSWQTPEPMAGTHIGN
ncbi:MAG: 23S rRNA (adenine(2030)-N(6))-methyltransferase RlmJ [Methylomonas sp.]|jgi:23S rRNA (adenine2030-N6)-methyltransferase